MSAFTQSGHSITQENDELTVRLRPQGDVRGANSHSPVPIYLFDGLIKPSTQVVPYQVAERKRPLEGYLAAGVVQESNFRVRNQLLS